MVAVNENFTNYQQIALEMILKRNECKTVINSGFMQLPKNRESVFTRQEIMALSRNKMLSAVWYKVKNNSEVCLFEFLDKDYQEIEMNIGIAHNNTNRVQHLVQPLVEGYFKKNSIEYTIKFFDM